MRRKVQFRISDETGANVASEIVYVLRPGANLTSGGDTTISAAGSGTVRVTHPGALKSGDKVFWRSVSDTVTSQMTLDSDPSYNAGGYWEITLNNATGSDITVGTTGRLVLDYTVSGSRQTTYDQDSGGTTTVGVPSIGTNGEVEFFVDIPDIDIAVTQGGTLSGYWVDVSADPRDFVTPEEFGAVGDASNDDAVAVQAAIDYASQAGSGIEVVFGAKSYKIGTALSFDGGGTKGIVLRGKGPKSTRIRPSGNINGIVLQDTLDCVIDGIEWRHHEGTATSGAMIKLDGANRCRIQNCLFTNPYTAIDCGKDSSSSKTKSVWVTDCHVDIGTGATNASQIIVKIYDTIGFYASGLQIGWGTATLAAGVDIDSGVDTASFVNCVSNQSGGGVGIGFRVRDSFTSDHDARWLHFQNCFAEGGDGADCWQFSAGNDISVENCYASGGTRGFGVTGGKDIRIANTIVFKNYTHGIRASGGSDVLIMGNTVYDCNRDASTYNGIDIAAGVTFVRVVDNVLGKVYGTAGGNSEYQHGIAIATDAAICTGNHINDGTANAIDVTGDRNILNANICQNATGYGIDVNSGATNNIVTSNVCLSNGAGQINDSGTSTEVGHNVES